MNKENEEHMLKQLRHDMLLFNIAIGLLILIFAVAFAVTIYKTNGSSELDEWGLNYGIGLIDTLKRYMNLI